VYRCAELLVHRNTANGAVWHDYAIVRLDRGVQGGRKPARVVMEPDAAKIGQGITALGFGDGIPGKVHTGATVNATLHELGYFMGSTDTFAGNSGSATYTDQHEILGVYVRGTESDYVKQGACQVVNVAREPRAKQEYSYAHRAVRDLCESGYPSERLCGSGEAEPDPAGEPDAGAEPDPSPDPAGDVESPSELDRDTGAPSEREPASPGSDPAGRAEPNRGERGRESSGCVVHPGTFGDPGSLAASLLSLLVTRRRSRRAARSQVAASDAT
jgi:hypothetical protein